MKRQFISVFKVETIAAEKRNVESFLEIKDETIRSLESNVNKLKKELENHLATANGHGQMETQIEEKQQQSLRNDKNVEELCTKVHQLVSVISKNRVLPTHKDFL